MLTNPRDAFRGQSRSSNIVPFHMLGIVSSCATVTLFKTRRFSDMRLQKMSNLEIRVRGHSRLLKLVPFDRLCMISYSCSIETVPKRYSTSNMPWPWQLGYGSVNVIGNVTMRYSAYEFLLTIYSNYGSISCRFWDIQSRKMSWPWNRFQRSLKVIESGAIR